MSSSLSDLIRNQHHVRLIWEERRLWLVPTVALGVLGSLFALIRPSVYVATLGLMVRDEAAGELSSYGGRFSTTDDRKAAQETILQIARNRQVVVNALKEVTPEKKQRKKNFPKQSLVRSWQDAISVAAAKGSELGESELIYLQVKGRSKQAAVQNTQAVGDQLRNYLNVLRNQRMDSVIQELTGKLNLAIRARDEATAQLEQMERKIGSNLGELRTLNQSGSGESNLRTSFSQIESDLRQARSAQTRQVQQLQFLRTAVQRPESIVVTPSGVLESHPALKRLKDGLVDAQLRLADLEGKMNPTHPSVRAAKIAVRETHEKLRKELKTAMHAAEADLRVNQALMNSYQRQLSEVNESLNLLASMRARYENLVADVQDRTGQVKESQRALSAAIASGGAAETTSLIAFVGKPEAGAKPIGPGRLTLIAASWLGGLSAGLGFLFLIAPPAGTESTGDWRKPVNWGRRASDRAASAGINFGRRAGDANARRQSDSEVCSQSSPAVASDGAPESGTKQRPNSVSSVPPLDTSNWNSNETLPHPNQNS